jgi:hypothetical protein
MKPTIIKILDHTLTFEYDLDTTAMRGWGFVSHAQDYGKISYELSADRRANMLLGHIVHWINFALEIGFDDLGVRLLRTGLWSFMVENGTFYERMIKLVHGKKPVSELPEENVVRLFSIDRNVRVLDCTPEEIRSYGHLHIPTHDITMASRELSLINRYSTFIHELLHAILTEFEYEHGETQIVAFQHGLLSLFSNNGFKLEELDWWIRRDDEYD